MLESGDPLSNAAVALEYGLGGSFFIPDNEKDEDIRPY